MFSSQFIASTKVSDPVEEGSKLQVGGKELEVIDLIDPQPLKTPIPLSTKSIIKPVNKSPLEPPTKKFKPPLSTAPVCTSSFMLPRPTLELQVLYNPFNKPLSDVYVPASVANYLKDYQKEGVEFLYKCVMGFSLQNYFGCILSDEMGLGKTLQTLSLVLTLLKGGPFTDSVAKRVLIVTPSSLVSNWDQEVNKWLKNERIFTFTVDGRKSIQQFANSPHIPLMLVSYEMFLKHSTEINSINFDLMICDEGHRLKNQNLKVYQELTQVDCKRRILLTGTPFQNCVDEYFAIIDFVNPGLFGSKEDFRVDFANPIMKLQDEDATEEELDIGNEKNTEMLDTTLKFIIRRTQERIAKQLPMKQDLVVFIRPSLLQREIISKLINFYQLQDEVSTPLEMITMLKKVSSHPNLLISSHATKKEQEVIELLFPEASVKKSIGFKVERSGKLIALNALLRDLNEKNEKVVVVSYSTHTLDMLREMIQANDYKFLRLDGLTKSQERSKIVSNFNDPLSDVFCLLLSAKSGGTGLNLIGASRLILFDNDWNPANDAQACARIYREGQKRNVFVYRFITCGTIEEKIWQRQISKSALGETVTDSESAVASNEYSFSDSEVKELFNVDEFDFLECKTHQLMGCSCSGDGSVPYEENELEDDTDEQTQTKTHQMMKYQHHKFPFDDEFIQEIGLDMAQDKIPFIFRHKGADFSKD